MHNDANLLFHWPSNGMNYFLKRKKRMNYFSLLYISYNDLAIAKSLSTIGI